MTEYRKARTAPIPSTRLFHNVPTLDSSLSGRGDGRMGGGPPAGLRDGVVAVTTPRVAAAHAAEGEPRAPHRTVRLDGFQAVGRAGGDVTAGRKAGADRAPDPAVAADGARQGPGRRAHERPAPASSSPMAASISAKGAEAAAGAAPNR